MLLARVADQVASESGELSVDAGKPRTVAAFAEKSLELILTTPPPTASILLSPEPKPDREPPLEPTHPPL